MTTTNFNNTRVVEKNDSWQKHPKKKFLYDAMTLD